MLCGRKNRINFKITCLIKERQDLFLMNAKHNPPLRLILNSLKLGKFCLSLAPQIYTISNENG